MIMVRELGDGDFEIVKGGDIYRKTRAGAVPDTVKAGEIASAAEICEWESFDIKIKVVK